MSYLGIDQKLRGSGFALLDDRGEYVKSTSVIIKPSWRGVERLQKLSEALRLFLLGEKIVAAAQEGYSVKSANRPYDLGMIAGIFLLQVYEEQNVVTLEVPPMSLKLFTSGYGAADKDDMLYTVKTRWGVDLGKRDDEADAVGLAKFAWATHNNLFSHRCEAEAVRALKQPRPRKRSKSPRTPNV